MSKICLVHTLIFLLNVGLQIKSGIWKKYLNLINKGSGTNGGPGIFVTLYKKAFENGHFFQFSPNFQLSFSKINKQRVFNNCIGPGIFSQKE